MLSRKEFIGKLDACKELLNDYSQWNQLPVVNYTSNNLLFDGQLVVYRGMVQDMFNPVLYLAKYEVKNNNTGETEIRCSEYADTLECADHEEVLLESNSSVYKERKPVYCVTVPGSSDWVEKTISERNSKNMLDLRPVEPQRISENKRDLNEDDKMEDESESVEGHSSNKRLCSRTSSERGEIKPSSNSNCNLNLPIGERSESVVHPAVLINIYEENIELSLNETIEVAGFLSCDPTTADELSDVTVEELPPLSVVPHIHAIAVRKLLHCNPLATPEIIGEVVSSAETTRADLHSVLRKVLLGDGLAADYLMIHLISSVFQRKDALVLGKYSLNLSNVPPKTDYAKLLYSFLTNIVPISHYVPMTVDHLNSVKLTPKKNYETNRLESGLLQLSSHTNLVLDETKMQPGKLLDRGVRNVQALSVLINYQKVDYDFQYYPVEFPMDIRVLVLSEGKSMLPSDCHVPLDYAETSAEYIKELFSEANRFVERESLVDQLRTYLSTVAKLAYDFSDSIETQITEDFVKMRREQEKTSPQDLHDLLVLARLFSLSRGYGSLTKETWEIVRDMEQQRKMRMEKR